MIDLEEYNILSRSLRELYVPAEQWLRAVEKFESNLYYEYRFSSQLYDSARNMYIMGYPFRKPIWFTAIEKIGRNIASDEVGTCAGLIEERAGNYIHNALGEEFLQYLDSNNDYGIVVHTTSGQIHPFQYSETTGFKHVIIPTTTGADIICEKLRRNKELDKNVPDEAWNMLKWKLQQKCLANGNTIYSAFYTMLYATDQGDMFYDPNKIYMDLTSHVFMQRTELLGTIDYMNTMYESHAKCIVVT